MRVEEDLNPNFGSATLIPHGFASSVASLPIKQGQIVLNQLSHTTAVVVRGVTGALTT